MRQVQEDGWRVKLTVSLVNGHVLGFTFRARNSSIGRDEELASAAAASSIPVIVEESVCSQIIWEVSY